VNLDGDRSMKFRDIEQRRWGWLVLFTSTTTLVCCALPIVLVTVGMGAVSAAIFSNLPFLGVMAANKVWLFLISGGLLMLASWALFRPGRTCPADPVLAEKCNAANRWNKRLLIASVLIWSVGFAAAYLSLPLFNTYERLTGG